MKTTYPNTMTLREARTLYFEVNGFGPTGGYDDAWVNFKLGPIPMPFPNTAGRIRAVRYHDLHHVLTGYDTDTIGEFEIAAWEISAGCKGFAAAWALNLGGMIGGTLSAPKRTLAAFVRGRHDRTTYGEDYDALLELTVEQARERFAPSRTSKATPVTIGLFAIALVAGLAVALVLFALVVPLVPLGLLAHASRRRRLALTRTT